MYEVPKNWDTGPHPLGWWVWLVRGVCVADHLETHPSPRYHAKFGCSRSKGTGMQENVLLTFPLSSSLKVTETKRTDQPRMTSY